MAGAAPNSQWLRGCVALDEKDFVLTGRELPLLCASETAPPWPLQRPPYSLETSLPGVFAIGDVQGGSVKRVASAVGEGATVVSLVHRVLEEVRRPARQMSEEVGRSGSPLRSHQRASSLLARDHRKK